MENNHEVKVIGEPEWFRGMFGRLIKREYLAKEYDWEIERLIGSEGTITHTIKDLYGNEAYRIGHQPYYYPASSLEEKVKQ